MNIGYKKLLPVLVLLALVLPSIFFTAPKITSAVGPTFTEDFSKREGPIQTGTVFEKTYSVKFYLIATEVPADMKVQVYLNDQSGVSPEVSGLITAPIPIGKSTPSAPSYPFIAAFDGLKYDPSNPTKLYHIEIYNANTDEFIKEITPSVDVNVLHGQVTPPPNIQSSLKPQCSDGIDNDGDTKIDFNKDGKTGDPDCKDPAGTIESACVEGVSGYCLLAPIPGIGDANGRVDIKKGIGDYLLGIIRFVIAMCGVLAVLMIVIAGIQYMSTDAISGKEDAKEKITNVIFGLIIALGGYIILNTINPQLTNFNTTISEQVVTVEESASYAELSKTFTGGGGSYTGGGGGGNVTKNISQYDSALLAAANKFGIECTFLKAFMYAESNGNPNAVSSVGAQGLIQLMPKTAEGLGYGGQNLFDPKINAEAAAKYVSQLQKNACNGSSSNAVCSVQDRQYVVAAYNGGPGSNKPSTTCPGDTWWQCTANQGYAETRNYVSKVLANYQKLVSNNWGCGTSSPPINPSSVLQNSNVGTGQNTTTTIQFSKVDATSGTISGKIAAAYQTSQSINYTIAVSLPLSGYNPATSSKLTSLNTATGEYKQTLAGLATGNYKVEIVETTSGKILATTTFTF